MTTNEILAKQNFITKVLFKDGDAQLSKELKVKIMAMRIEYKKIRDAFDADIQEFIKQATPEGFQELQQKVDRTEEEQKELQEMIDKLNEEYNQYVNTRSAEEVNVSNTNLTEDEYNQIVEVMAGTDVEINNQTIPSADYLELMYTLFVA